MSKPILLNAFPMNTVGHHGRGMGTHPRDRSRHYNELGYWLDLARTLERGCFDGIFLADVLGVYDVYQGTPDAVLRNASRSGNRAAFPGRVRLRAFGQIDAGRGEEAPRGARRGGGSLHALDRGADLDLERGPQPGPCGP
jgi:alkanesulfonate monooxygenase SsuD/methylene tetrahydromethanopterin reductase-like flavin-dependent oxidoreductase (luciferase family)